MNIVATLLKSCPCQDVNSSASATLFVYYKTRYSCPASKGSPKILYFFKDKTFRIYSYLVKINSNIVHGCFVVLDTPIKITCTYIINSQGSKFQWGSKKKINFQNFDSGLCSACFLRFSASQRAGLTPWGSCLVLNGNASVTFFVPFGKSDIFENTISENIENNI